MAGLGRRSHYRKHLTDSILHDFPEPRQGERIAKVVGTRGSNQFEIVVASDNQQSIHNDVDSREAQLAILPTKFRKLIWLKRNDYVIVTCAQEEDGDRLEGTTGKEAGGIRYMIAHILYKEQVKHLKREKLWPADPFFGEDDGDAGGVGGADFSDFGNARGRTNHDDDDDDDSAAQDNHNGEDDDQDDDDDNGIVYDDHPDFDDDYFVNTNRIAKLTVDDSSDSEDDSR